MSQPFTIQYGQWLPDLQNIATQIQNQFGATPIPVADCLNVYYQDGAYRCLASPVQIGPSIGAPTLTAFTWYDNVEGQEILFAATASGISQIIDGTLSQVPVETFVTVGVTGWSLTMVLHGSTQPPPLKLAMKLGTVTVIGGQLLNASLFAQSSTSNNITNTGYVVSSIGNLTPTKTADGKTINAIYQFIKYNPAQNLYTYNFILQIAGTQASNYFSKLTFPSISTTLTSSTASFTQQSGYAQWAWVGTSVAISQGFTYPVQLFR